MTVDQPDGAEADRSPARTRAGHPVLGALVNPDIPPAARQLQEIEDATSTIGQELFVAQASNDTELKAAFVSLIQQRIGALLVAADAYFDTRRDRIIAFAAENKGSGDVSVS